MRTEQPTKCFTEGELGAVNMFKPPPPPQLFITDRSNAVAQLWFYDARLWCQSFGDVSSYVCSYYFYFGLGC